MSNKADAGKEAEARLGELLRAVDDIFNKRYRKLTYEEDFSFNEDENDYHIVVSFKEEENYINKIRYLSKLSCVRFVNTVDKTLVFRIVLPKKGQIDIHDISEHDSSKEAWEFYRCKYASYLSDEEITYKGAVFRVHGEVDFNFGLERIRGFEYIIDNDDSATDEEKELAKELLKVCGYYNYSLLNFSLMPSEGNLQSTKGTIGNDRFDVFIWALDLYYKGESDLIINSHTTAEMLKDLVGILDCFDMGDKSCKYYCRFFYDLDEELIAKLIASGRKRIDTTARVLEYIALAYSYWQARYDEFTHGKCRESYYRLEGDNVLVGFMKYIEQLKKYM